MNCSADTVQFLVSLKYPENAALTKGEAERYALELYHMPDDEFDRLFVEEEVRFKKELKEKEAAEEPTRFYNLDGAGADFQEWGRFAHWTLDEAIALSLGKNPKIVNWRAMQAYRSSPFFSRYAELRARVHQALLSRHLFEPTIPGTYIAWARQNGIEFPLRLEEEVQACDNDGPDWKMNYKSLMERCQHLFSQVSVVRDEPFGSLSQRAYSDHHAESGRGAGKEEGFGAIAPASVEIPQVLAGRGVDDLFKLIAAMAMAKYRDVPAPEHRAHAVANDLMLVGVPIDVSIVGSWLHVANAILV